MGGDRFAVKLGAPRPQTPRQGKTLDPSALGVEENEEGDALTSAQSKVAARRTC